MCRAHQRAGRRRHRRRRAGDGRAAADGGGGVGEEGKKGKVGEPEQPVADVLVEEVDEGEQVRGDGRRHLRVNLCRRITGNERCERVDAGLDMGK